MTPDQRRTLRRLESRARELELDLAGLWGELCPRTNPENPEAKEVWAATTSAGETRRALHALRFKDAHVAAQAKAFEVLDAR